MLKKYCFKVADLTFSVYVPEKQNVNQLLPSFKTFLYETEERCNNIFCFLADSVELCRSGKYKLLEESHSDLGNVRLLKGIGGYRMEITTTRSNITHYLNTDCSFRYAVASVSWNDPHVGEAINSMLRIIYSQAVLHHSGISVHSAAVILDEKAYLFMGRSGTGKSTHASLWLKTFPGSELLNDDNPTIRIVNGKVMVYGTPWSGKTPCYKNKSSQIAGIVRLRQSRSNKFILQEEVNAFVTLLPGCSVISEDFCLREEMCDTLVELLSKIPIGILECLPEKEAAVLCAKTFKELSKNK